MDAVQVYHCQDTHLTTWSDFLTFRPALLSWSN